MNINLVRTAAVVRGHRPPIIAINCEVTTRNYREFTRLIAMASALDVATVQFSDVFETATAIMHGVRPITMADSVTKKKAAAEFQRAKALATARGVTISVSSARLEGLLMNSGDADADAPAANLSTVLCLQP